MKLAFSVLHLPCPMEGLTMRDYKTGLMEERYEEELRPLIARSLGISEARLARHPFERDGWTLRWLEKGPPEGISAPAGITEVKSPAK